jgi:hypothetical protein
MHGSFCTAQRPILWALLNFESQEHKGRGFRAAMLLYSRRKGILFSIVHYFPKKLAWPAYVHMLCLQEWNLGVLGVE